MKILRSLFFCSTLCCLPLLISAQNTISGKLINERSEAVPYAQVALEGSSAYTISNEQGEFSFRNLRPGKYILHVKAFGYRSAIDTVKLDTDVARQVSLQSSASQLDEVIVDATRVDGKSGMAFNNIGSAEIAKQNLGQDAPYILNNLPNVVVNSDAGNGVGYTGIRIRGSDATRINVTINGVPVNDAESQGTFWVNMPDLISSVNNVQVQRGVGASTNGAGSFGATINFQTNQLNEKPYAGVISTAGSFNTFRNTLSAGTGLLRNGFFLDARASKITSAGYIDRASSNLSSYYLTGGWYGKKTVAKLINFNGWERTYQAWYYVPEDSIKAGNRTYNPAGEYYNKDGVVSYYKNETDNYNQNNSQLHVIHQINKRMVLNVTGHYTRGKGYYEQYKPSQDLADYTIEPAVTSSGDTLSQTDLIRRLWLDNHFAGGIANLRYTTGRRFDFTFGGAYHNYFGKHFGRVIWARNAGESELDHQYYLNSASKEDQNIYLKTNYRLNPRVNFFVDLQTRSVKYRFLGFDEFLEEKMQQVNYQFFNPKLGVSADLSAHLNVYASFAVANKEPNRDDFVNSSPQSRPKHEQLQDLEGGVRYSSEKIVASVNLYNMQYRDQLVLNGEINNVGAYNRINVPESYRRGIELEVGFRPGKFIGISGNLSLSRNKIKSFTEFIDSSDVDGTVFTQFAIQHHQTDISFSPNLVSSTILSIYPLKKMELAFIYKTVGRQFLDNTSNNSRSINPYEVLDLRLNYTISTKVLPEVTMMLSVYNLLSRKYETNGYTFGYYYGPDHYSYNYLAPAAPVNFLAGVSLKF